MVNEDVFFFCEYLVGMMFSGSRIRGGGQLNGPHYTDVRVCVCGPDSRRDLISWLPRAQLSLSKELFQLESTSYSGKIHISRLYYMKQDTLDSSGQIAPPG